ncbi:nitroreductase [Kineothrix alysoides]|uniref:Nitroreductase n=1 Tax=Kineothrix alysoides TaxID=1469948 RepID=A0A4R1QR99_9FIRM|nr:nitroreductase family protein [Kineothrix alysoides]TCL56328.1 nitroreductase [Kineothrix alysoides]
MNLYDTIQNRISVREYQNKNFDSMTLDKVKALLSHINPLYKDIEVRLELVHEDVKSAGMGFMNGYIKIQAPYCVAAISEKRDGYMENIGFIQEQAVLELTGMGIGSCWLGTFDNEVLRHLLKVNDNEVITNVIALGYPEEKSFRNDGLRKLLGSKRKKETEIAFYKEWGEDAAIFLDNKPLLRKILKASILAPSGGNKQPVCLVFTEDSVHFFVKNKKDNIVINPWAAIDAGIFISHFYFCCLEESIHINFYKDSSEEKFKIPSDTSYIISMKLDYKYD